MRTNELILYRYMEHEDLLRDMTFLIDNADNDYYNKEDLKSLLFENLNELIELAANYGFEGNLWHTFLTFLLANSENAYSTACEVVGEVEGSVNKAALHDFQIFKELFEYDLKEMGEKLGTDSLELIEDYHPVNAKGHVFNKRIRDRICDLSKALAQTDDAEEFKTTVPSSTKNSEWELSDFTRHSVLSIRKKEHRSCRSPRSHTSIWMIWWVMTLPRRN